jgi:Tfp pilus assembly protein PilZ
VGKSGKNRRKHKRIAKRLSVLIEVDGTYTQGHIKNLSKNGVFVRGSVLPEPGSQVRLKFETLGGSKIDVAGRVCWTTAGLPKEDAASGFGVLLDDPGEDFREFFAALLDG